MIIFLIFLFFLSFILICYRAYKVKPIVHEGLKELPVEKGFPILGILPQIESPLHNYLLKLSKKHGPIYRIKIGFRDVVVLNNFDVLKKSLKENGTSYSGRIKFHWVAKVSRDSGVIFTDGDNWVKQRSFILSALRVFGLGKPESLEIVQSECLFLVDELTKLNGKCVDLSHLIPIYTANIISKFIMNKRFSREDPNFLFILKLVMKIGRGKDFVSLFQIMFPFFDYSKIIDNIIMALTSRWKMFEEAHSFFQKEIEEHKDRLDLRSEPEDLIDSFLLKQKENKEKIGDNDYFCDFQLIRNSLELFIAGYETTSTTLVWSFFFMCKFPDIQEKIYQEIIDVIGSERMPTMNDKKSLNYTQAVMDEIMRLSSVIPIAFKHRTLTNSVINGYFIPKNSFIFPNLYGSHFDPDTWDSPMKFIPERFISVDSNGKIKYSPREDLIPFSIGKRQCIGEVMARIEYFIFFITILQRFKVHSSEEISQKKYEEVLLGNDGFVRFCKVKDFTFSARL